MTRSPIPVLDVGGTHVTAALVDLDTLRMPARATRALDAQGTASSILAAIRDAASEIAAGPGRTWGIAMPGPFDYEAGRGGFEGVAKFASISGLDMRAALSEPLATEPHLIRFLNDADAYALGEWDAQGRPDRLMCATLGTGVGGGFIDSGRIVTTDPRVPASGDFYHLTWRGAPLEDHVSRRAFIRDFGSPELDVKDIAELARAGDAAAIGVFERGMGVLADVLTPWVDSFRPDIIVIGGAIARSWDVIGPELQAALGATSTLTPEVRPSRLHDGAPLVGAAEFVHSTMPTQERKRI